MKLAINIELTDQTGKGNKDIVKAYGSDAFEFSDTFLDNVRLCELEEKLGVKIIPVAHDGSNMISTVKNYFEGRK